MEFGNSNKAVRRITPKSLRGKEKPTGHRIDWGRRSMTRKRLVRIVLYGDAALCALLLLYWIGAELYGNYIAAQWEAAGYPNL